MHQTMKMLVSTIAHVVILVVALFVTTNVVHAGEQRRLEEYHKRNYTWPLSNYVPDTPGWKALMERRLRQVDQLPVGTHDRWEGYIRTIHAAALVPNFTEHGFGLARCPDELLAALQKGIRDGLPTAYEEEITDAIVGPQPPLIVSRPDLTDRVLHELKHYAETWTQMPLTPHAAYGFRLYRNESQLWMHVDRMQTHIISFILHIDSSEDAEPWPIHIEDFHGRTHEVILKAGDMLFYESSKCFHGRPKKLNGSWYSSLFVHYYPTYGWTHVDREAEAIYAVPPHWNEKVQVEPLAPGEEPLPRLKMVGTSMKEPDCPNEWCATIDPVKWSGPGEAGKWIAPTFERYPFEPQEVIWDETKTAAMSQPSQASDVSDHVDDAAEGEPLQEPQRLGEYHKRNYTWPLNNYSPSTPGWKALMERRLRQIEQLPYPDRRYEGFIRTIHAATLVPNFTEHGFGLARCPDELLGALQKGVHDGLAAGDTSEEPFYDVISGPNRPLLVKRPDLEKRVLQELHDYVEAWAQIPLTSHAAYGFRLYRNESQVLMHIEQMQTNVISVILHIDSSEDAEPWPIFIEDFHGNTHEVILTPGDMLLYESSKCFHGHPKKFNGSWYGSIFAHYYPEHGWYEQNHELEAHYAVPPHWSQQAEQLPEEEMPPRLEMVGSSMMEPDCPNDWCATLDSVKWSGPGEAGTWIAPTLERYPFKFTTWNEEL